MRKLRLLIAAACATAWAVSGVTAARAQTAPPPLLDMHTHLMTENLTADEEIALGDACRGRWTAVLDVAHEHALTVGQTNGAAHSARNPRRSDADAQSRPLGAFAALQGRHARAQRLISGQRQIETAAQPIGVEADEAAFRVDQSAA